MTKFPAVSAVQAAAVFTAMVGCADVSIAQDADYRMFFGKSIQIRMGLCRESEADDKCMPNADATPRTISFDDSGVLSEAFLCGDRVARKHAFGKTTRVKKEASGGSSVECDLTLAGVVDTIQIVTSHRMKFDSGGSSFKIDQLEFATRDGKTCTLTGSREIVDLPENNKSNLRVVVRDCVIR